MSFETLEEIAEDLEPVVDRVGLKEVIDTLVYICYEKAEHLESAWQDAEAAKAWTKAGIKLDKLSDAPVIKEVS
jgi:hypothetical protein